MKYIGGVSIVMWIFFAIITTLVWSKSYYTGYDKCISDLAPASDADVQKLIEDLRAGNI